MFSQEEHALQLHATEHNKLQFVKLLGRSIRILIVYNLYQPSRTMEAPTIVSGLFVSISIMSMNASMVWRTHIGGGQLLQIFST